MIVCCYDLDGYRISEKDTLCLEAVFDRRFLKIADIGGQRPPLNEKPVS
jgi:hypothetical protein